MTKTKLLPAALLGAFMLAGCEYSNDSIVWEEEGIWSCTNAFTNVSISFDTKSEETTATVGRGFTINFRDIDTGLKAHMDADDGWVCTYPSGKEKPFEITPNL